MAVQLVSLLPIHSPAFKIHLLFQLHITAFVTVSQHWFHFTWRMVWSAYSLALKSRHWGLGSTMLISSYKLLFPFSVVSGLKSMLYTHWGLFNNGWILFAHTIGDLFFWYSRYFLKKKRLASVTFECCKKSSIWNHEYEYCSILLYILNELPIHWSTKACILIT